MGQWWGKPARHPSWTAEAQTALAPALGARGVVCVVLEYAVGCEALMTAVRQCAHQELQAIARIHKAAFEQRFEAWAPALWVLATGSATRAAWREWVYDNCACRIDRCFPGVWDATRPLAAEAIDDPLLHSEQEEFNKRHAMPQPRTVGVGAYYDDEDEPSYPTDRLLFVLAVCIFQEICDGADRLPVAGRSPMGDWRPSRVPYPVPPCWTTVEWLHQHFGPRVRRLQDTMSRAAANDTFPHPLFAGATVARQA